MQCLLSCKKAQKALRFAFCHAKRHTGKGERHCLLCLLSFEETRKALPFVPFAFCHVESHRARLRIRCAISAAGILRCSSRAGGCAAREFVCFLEGIHTYRYCLDCVRGARNFCSPAASESNTFVGNVDHALREVYKLRARGSTSHFPRTQTSQRRLGRCLGATSMPRGGIARYVLHLGAGLTS